jgi:hypothetical protein
MKSGSRGSRLDVSDVQVQAGTSALRIFFIAATSI